MRIGMKLILGFVLVAVIAAVVGVVGILNMRTIDEADTKLYEKMTVPLGSLAKVALATQRIRVNVRDYMDADNGRAKQDAFDKITALAKEVHEAEVEFQKTILTDEGRAAFKKFTDAFEKYMDLVAKAKDLDDRGQEKASRLLMTTEGLKVALQIQDEIKELIESKSHLAKATAEDNNKVASRGSFIMIVAIIFGVLLAVGLGIFLTYSITRPLAAGVVFSQKVAAGDLTATVDVNSKDELGDLARALNETVSKLKDSMLQITEASSQVKSASEQIAQGNQDLSARTEQQAAAVEETAASMEEMATSIKSNTQNAQEVNNLAIDAAGKAGAGVNVVGDVVTAMSGITESSQKIGQIIEVMNNIAFQTNLLALNASIEAARAGEQGRGFAVVAVEVRKLAQRSEEASREITQLIQESNHRVGTGAELVKKAGTSLDEINLAVGKVKNLVAEISAASQEQLSGVDQINKTIVSLDQNTQQNSSLVEESASAAEELSSQAQELFAIVSQFKIGETKAQTTTNRTAAKQIGHGDTKSQTPSRSQEATMRLGHGDGKGAKGAHGPVPQAATAAHGKAPVHEVRAGGEAPKGEAKSMTLHTDDRKKGDFVEF